MNLGSIPSQAGFCIAFALVPGSGSYLDESPDYSTLLKTGESLAERDDFTTPRILWDYDGAGLTPYLSGSGGEPYRIATLNEIPSEVGEVNPRDTNSTVLYDTKAGIAYLRACLNINITELAAILQVTRPTIYSWLNGDRVPHPTNRQRLQLVYRISKSVESTGKSPVAGALHSLDERGQSILDLLCQDTIDEDTIVERLRQANSSVVDEQHERKDLNLADIARKHGIPYENINKRGSDIDILTGIAGDIDDS